MLVSFLVAFGAAVNSGPHAIADGAEHPARLFVVLVGRTSRGRKGTAWANVRLWMAVTANKVMTVYIAVLVTIILALVLEGTVTSVTRPPRRRSWPAKTTTEGGYGWQSSRPGPGSWPRAGVSLVRSMAGHDCRSRASDPCRRVPAPQLGVRMPDVQLRPAKRCANDEAVTAESSVVSEGGGGGEISTARRRLLTFAGRPVEVPEPAAEPDDAQESGRSPSACAERVFPVSQLVGPDRRRHRRTANLRLLDAVAAK